MVYSCTVFGLQIRSEIPLPELDSVPDTGNAAADVEISLGTVGVPDVSEDLLDMRLSVQPEFTWLGVPTVGRFQISNGRRIVVDALPGCSTGIVRVYVLGSAFGALLFQRGMLPLHANAIEVDGRVFAFAGRSGAGKSTLAAYFNDRNYRVLCDDVCAVSFNADGVPLVWPGLPRLKLCADALEARGRNTNDFHKVADDYEKYHFPVRYSAGGPYPLDRLYDLGPGSQSSDSQIVRLSRPVALNVILTNIYRRRLAELSANPQLHLQQAAFLIQRTEVYAVQRQWGFDAFSDEATKLELHLRS